MRPVIFRVSWLNKHGHADQWDFENPVDAEHKYSELLRGTGVYRGVSDVQLRAYVEESE